MYSCTHASILPRNYALERIVGEDGEDVNLQNGNISTLFIQNKGFYQKKKTIFAFRDPFALIAALYSVGM